MRWLGNSCQRTHRGGAPDGNRPAAIMILVPILGVLIWAALIYAMVAML